MLELKSKRKEATIKSPFAFIGLGLSIFLTSAVIPSDLKAGSPLSGAEASEKSESNKNTGNLPTKKPSAKSDASTDDTGLELVCQRDHDRRTLIILPDNLGCKLHYQKGAKAEIIARSQNSYSLCEGVRGKIRKKLESAGFKCESIKE